MKPFSTRVPADLTPNRLTRAIAGLRASQTPFVDLTETNPTRVGLRYPDGLLETLVSAGGRRYEPAPLGMGVARCAVARHLQRSGVEADPARIVLTASTSEAYALLFKLLGDAGHEVLVPSPSYPLFEHLARLEGLTPVPYPLDFHGRWAVDLAGLRAQVSPRTRVVIVVNPNTPTGSFVTPDEADQIAGVCRGQGVAMIVDEVFGLYPLTEPRRSTGLRRSPDVLTFGLGGLSKAVGLPQLKMAWALVTGPRSLVATALERLEVIGDTYLSVATPVQLAAPALLEAGRTVTRQIRDRVRDNYARVRQLVASHPTATLLPAEGGWYAVLQVPGIRSEETLVLELLTRDHVLVHPGYFFDFPREAFLVLSLLPAPQVFESGVRRVLEGATLTPAGCR